MFSSMTLIMCLKNVVILTVFLSVVSLQMTFILFYLNEAFVVENLIFVIDTKCLAANPSK